MKYFSFLFILLVACTNQTTKSEVSSEKLPNVVLLVGDDQGYPYFGFMGADYVETPNMDILANSGTLFTNGYVPDNHCRPSLATLMTGVLPIQYEKEAALKKEELMTSETYLALDQEGQATWNAEYPFQSMNYFTTLPEILATKGYLSFQGGKWWEFNYQNGGFTHGMTEGWTPHDKENGGKWFKQFMGGSGLELARATMQPAYDFIDLAGDTPFFLWYAPELPHYPFDAPDKYYSIYADQDMTESAKRYYANCTWFDDGVGELIRYLKEKGKFENTLFIYVNDNGWEQEPDQEFRHDSPRWHNGGDKGKLSLFDQSFRSPIIFSWQGKIKSGQRRTDLIHSADIPATILDYVGFEVPEGYYGTSYREVLDGEVANPRDKIMGNITQTRWEGDMMGRKLDGYWIRTPDWFYSYNATDSVHSLYNMVEDAKNNNNLAEVESGLTLDFYTEVEAYRQSMR